MQSDGVGPLPSPENTLAIFDVFVDETARNAHFTGKAAGLLNAKSSVLVEGGRDDGVVANIKSFDIIAIK
ncbi:MAG: hypothetical protein P8Q26_16170 [Ascidiaceihabitans sp.]|nr:hypothetical protein [Ascidiaceihabitans sp.]